MKQVKTVSFLLCMIMAASGCRVQEPVQQKEDVINREWVLLEMRDTAGSILLNRPMLEAEGLGDAYTSHFTEDTVYGKAAPNAYNASCRWEYPFTLTIEPALSTMQPPFIQLPLDEEAFFSGLSRVYRWNIPGEGFLELFLVDENGDSGSMLFGKR